MIKITIPVEGMMCGMCEAHVNDAIRKAFEVKLVKSSHKNKETVVITEKEIDLDALKKVITDLGYTVGEEKTEEYKKKGLFGFLKK